ncbi:MAG: hypothetical protein IKD83_07120 [Firmicutes bacterium]|nr:hypothetical protein [Bacillota bacterium]MBQ7241479.1 hypothetical protein [Bacillota bacterium]MBR0104031.1 hypothetical protein [Bacillota bacterium]MBR2594375.1 hypothetical protein [Bacillota bacterium]
MYKGKLSEMHLEALFEAILKLETIDECFCFFEDLCTISEIKAMSQRLEVAKMLKAGATFNTIVEKTGASTATISRVNRCINYGAGGYDKILGKL